MPNFPNFPFSPYRNYIPYPNPNFNSNIAPPISPNKKVDQSRITNNTNNNTNNHNIVNPSDDNSNTNISQSVIKQTSSDSAEENRSNINEEPYLFDLFGIKLYFDDILLICLIFFLYNEGVKDEGLFFALILLLLS